MRRPCLLASLLAFSALPGPAGADTLYVDAAGLTPFSSIQGAIDVAADGDVILVFPGTYGPIDFLGKDLVVRSIVGPATTTIDATGSGGPGATFTDTEPATALLHGFEITGGEGYVDDGLGVAMGGGIYVSKLAGPRISGNVIVGNTAVAGAGIAVTGGSPHIYGNIIQQNTATSGAGGIVVQSPTGVLDTTVIACNQLLGNDGGSVGGLFVGGDVAVTNNVVHGNSGERGGIWVVSTGTGALYNNTVTTNVSDPFAAAGIHIESVGVEAVGNLVVSNAVGVGVVHSDPTPPWSYNDVWGNAGGDWSGASPDPTGTAGNLSVEPTFVLFTPTNPLDDDLALSPLDPLLDGGSPDAAYADVDGSRGAVGIDGGPHTNCDADGDGVRVTDVPTDCQPDEGDFHPGAYELELGLDHDCDGFGTLQLIELVVDDGGFTSDASGVWEFGSPTALPGRGWQGANAWCTDCAGPAGANADATLTLTADLTSVPAGTGTRVALVHAYDADPTGDGGILQSWDGAQWVQVVPSAGYPAALDGATIGNALVGSAAAGTWSGDSGGYVEDAASLSAWSGATVDLRLWYGSSSSSTAPGWTVARLALQVVDQDGDGRADAMTDCDDTDATVYDGAPEVPYDGIDQDCDGADLLDVDGDGYDGTAAGGDDCDDTDAATNPAGIEIAYDGVDQDCSGADLDDVDGDGAASTEVGGLDCDDEDPAISPDAPDLPYDGIDQDCDGADLVDVDGDGFRGDLGPPFGDCDDEDDTVYPEAPEICDDGKDNDCNELVDAELDLDEDGYDVCAGDCDETAPEVNPGAVEACDGVDGDCDGLLLDGEVDDDGDGDLVCDGDCDDQEPSIGPSRPEVCDGVDNDCDFAIDEGQDADGDGFSGCTSDCDDQRSSVYPGAAVDCADNLDHDCDGVRDFEQDVCAAPGGCGSSVVGDGEPGLLVLLMLGAGLAWRRQRSLRTQPAPDTESPPGTSPGASFRAVQAR